MIILRPGSGLCNRLRAIGSAIRLAQEASCPLRVEWFRCPIRRWAAKCGMRTAFRDLFESIDGVEMVEKIRWRDDFPWDAMKWSPQNATFYGSSDCGRKVGIARARAVEDVMRNPAQARWLWTCFDFHHNPDYSWIKPRTHIMNRVAAVSAAFEENCIGIHVRRTDNQAAIDGSPLSLFTDKMDAEMEANRNVRFFLSTDDDGTRQVLRDRYGHRLISCDNVSQRYTLKGEEDAVVDLWLLSRTRKIFGSYWSSFSEVAAQIGGIPIDVLVKEGVALPAWIVK